MPQKVPGKNLDIEKDIEEVMKPKKNEKRDQLYAPQDSSLGKIAFTFIGFAILLLLAIFYFSYSYTTIVITPNPQTETFETEVKVELPLTPLGPNNENPLEEIRNIIDTWSKNNPDTLFGETVEVAVQGSDSFSPTGDTGREEPGIAHGIITITNQQSDAQELIAKTRFVPEGGDIIFRIKDGVTVPANGELEVEVFADEPGAKGNIGLNKFYLPGFSSETKRKLVYAQSDVPMTGGVKKITTLSQADIDNGKINLQKKLFNQALIKLENKIREAKSYNDKVNAPQNLPTREGLKEETPEEELWLATPNPKLLAKATWQEVIEAQAKEAIGDEVETFTLTMNLRVITLIFSEKELLEVTKNLISKEFKNQKILILHSVVEESLDYSIKTYDAGQNTAILAATIKGEIITLSENLLDKKELGTLTTSNVQVYLDKHPEIKGLEIKEGTPFLRKIPIFKDHVRVKMKTP